MDNWHSKHETLFGSDLDERVKLWQQSIQPHLEAQEKQPSFDIQLYSRDILDTVNSKVFPMRICTDVSIRNRLIHI